MTKVLILGGGFGGFYVFKSLEKSLGEESSIQLSLVSETNYFLFTPMLPEIAAATLHPSDITIPIRAFSKSGRFYHAKVLYIDFHSKVVRIMRVFDGSVSEIDYDYLVISLGSTNNFFDNKKIEDNVLTIKSLEDAIAIRNHVITMLENADQEKDDVLKKKLLTFVVVGGGFAGVETAGELNHFVRDSVKFFYKNVDQNDIRVILVSSKNGILPEVSEELGRYSFTKLQETGVEILTNVRAIDAGEDYVLLNDNTIIPCTTVIWSAGTKIKQVISQLPCKHDKKGRILVNEFLRINSFPTVYCLGDCAHVVGDGSPSTAQHALKQAEIVSKNLLVDLIDKGSLKKFGYKNKGFMAIIGKRNAVAEVGSLKLVGFKAWILWRYFYLSNIPSKEKMLRVLIDWILDLFFTRDVITVGQVKKKTITKLDHPMRTVFSI